MTMPLEGASTAILFGAAFMAGAMNAVVMSDGWLEGGPDGARTQLESFWRHVSLDGGLSEPQRRIFDVFLDMWSPVASNALFVFMIAWNEFLFALLFLVEKRENWTVSLGLSQLAGSIEVPTTVLMAGSVILTVPIIVLFFLSERWLAGGLTAGAEKG